MEYKDILVHLDDGGGCAARVAAAVDLAARHGAHLVGAYPALELAPSTFIETQIPDATRARMEAESKERAEAALAAFRDAAGRGGIGHEARALPVRDGAVAQRLAFAARFADLVVLGPGEPGEAGVLPWRIPEEVVLEAGRPALVVPAAGAPATLGGRVVVAWDASRAAARALGDALPILERAGSVLVVTVDPRATPVGGGEPDGLDRRSPPPARDRGRGSDRRGGSGPGRRGPVVVHRRRRP